MKLLGGIGAITVGCVVAASVGTGAAASGDQRPTVTPSATHQTAVALVHRSAWPPAKVFGHRTLVAYYGTAGTNALGVLGSAPPDQITKRLRKAAAPFATKHRKVQIVYELIVTIADADPGSDGDYSHDIPKSSIQEYIKAARKHHALLVLDIQPGRSSFVPKARELRWALRYPFVGIALDPEWRVGPHQKPAQVIGSVDASEINQVSTFVARLTRRNDLPQKLFLIHQFTTGMVRHIGQIKKHGVLAMVQHMDGFGSHQEKLATLHNVAKPKRFYMGFKLFYHQDSDLFTPTEVKHISPHISFVSYQ